MFTQPSSRNALKTIIVKGWKDFGLVNAFGIDKTVTTINWCEQDAHPGYASFDAATDLFVGTTRSTTTQVDVVGNNA